MNPPSPAEIEAALDHSDRYYKKLKDAIFNGVGADKHPMVILAAAVRSLQAEVAAKESDRQYHMNAINRLAKRIGALGETSDSVVEKAIRALQPKGAAGEK